MDSLICKALKKGFYLMTGSQLSLCKCVHHEWILYAWENDGVENCGAVQKRNHAPEGGEGFGTSVIKVYKGGGGDITP